MAKRSEMLQPQYAAGFRCIGPECEDDCCHGWQVSIDKQTYRKYRNCQDLHLRNQLETCVTRNRSNPSDSEYARMKLNDGVCSMMDSDRLCTLQRALGEDYLSITCASYPRFFRTVNETTEMALAFSCPEAARLGLLNPKVMEFEVVSNPYSRTNQGFLPFNSEDSRYKNKAERFFWPLRIFIITLLQNRSYPLWQRLVILGFFCQAVQNVETSSEIPAVIERYTRLIEQGTFREELEAIPTNNEVQVDLLRQLVLYRLTGTERNSQFVDLVDKAETVIGLKDDTEKEQAASTYRAAFETYYHPFMTEHEYVLENYLVNYVFKNAFPFGKKRLFDDYVLLVVHYAMVKMLLIGLAGYYKGEFSLDHVVKLIYSFSRMIDHHGVYVENVYQLLKDDKLDTMAYMAVLIRN